MGSRPAAVPCSSWMAIPVYWYPACANCSREMASCAACGGQVCLCTPHVCAAETLIAGIDDDFEDSPRGGASDDASTVLVSGTGGMPDVGEAQPEMYPMLNVLWSSSPGTFTYLADHTWARSKYLDQLSRCYTSDDGADEYRQFGSTHKDWERLARYMQWDVLGIVVINLTRQKCMVYRSGETPELLGDCTSIVQWLRSYSATLGILQRSVEESRAEYCQFDVWWDLGERCRPRSKAIDKVLNRLTKTIIGKFHNVSFWRS